MYCKCNFQQLVNRVKYTEEDIIIRLFDFKWNAIEVLPGIVLHMLAVSIQFIGFNVAFAIKANGKLDKRTFISQDIGHAKTSASLVSSNYLIHFNDNFQ